MATRTEIENYLCVRDSIDAIVNAILNKTLSVDNISRCRERDLIKLTIINIERRKAYLNKKSLYEAAVNDFKAKGNFNEAIPTIANMYGIDGLILHRETTKFLEANYYVFDEIIEGEYISYVQEETLWQFLKYLVELKQISCTCRICFLLELSKQAFVFAKRWNTHWLHSTRKEWLANFEMRYRNEISNFCSKQCTLSCESQ